MLVFNMAAEYLPCTKADTIDKRVLLLIVLALPSLIAVGKECVPGVTYYDPVTTHCDPCGDICDFTGEQGTQDRCDKLCQGYNARHATLPRCAPGQYYDINVDRCEPCQSICLHPPGDDCKAHCPDWTQPIDSVTMDTDTHNVSSRNTSAVAALEMNDDDNGESQRSTPWLYVILIGAAVVICAVLAAVLWKPITKNLKGIVHRRNCNRRPQQEEDGGTPMLYCPDRIVRSGPMAMPGSGPIAYPTEDV